MIDAQTLLDYIGDLDNESDIEVIRKFEQAKADCADSWILDGNGWVRSD